MSLNLNTICGVIQIQGAGGSWLADFRSKLSNDYCHIVNCNFLVHGSTSVHIFQPSNNMM